MLPPDWLTVTSSRVDGNALVLKCHINWRASGVADWLAAELAEQYPDVAPSAVRKKVQSFIEAQPAPQE